MTDAQAGELIGVVKATLLPQIQGHPEVDDMLGEALLRAYQAVEALPLESHWRWTTIAAKAARWQALEYLRQRRSGRLTAQRAEAAILPENLESIPADLLPTHDGGIEAADARLQLHLLRVPLSPRQREVVRLVHWHELNLGQAAQVMGIAGNSARDYYETAMARYRLAAGVVPEQKPRRCKQCRADLSGTDHRRRFCGGRCKAKHQDYRRPSRYERERQAQS